MFLRKHYKLNQLSFEPEVWIIAFRELNKGTRSLHFEVAASNMDKCVKPLCRRNIQGLRRDKVPSSLWSSAFSVRKHVSQLSGARNLFCDRSSQLNLTGQKSLLLREHKYFGKLLLMFIRPEIVNWTVLWIEDLAWTEQLISYLCNASIVKYSFVLVHFSVELNVLLSRCFFFKFHKFKVFNNTLHVFPSSFNSKILGIKIDITFFFLKKMNSEEINGFVHLKISTGRFICIP